MPELRTPPAHEPGPQPDPMLERGRRAPGWTWLIALVVVIVVVGTLYALNTHKSETETASHSSPPQTTGQSSAPQSAMPGGRTSGSAPPQAPAQVQNQGGQNSQGSQSTQGNKQ